MGTYQIYEGTTPGSLTKVATTTAASYTARSLSPSTTYYFEIVAVDTSYDDSAPTDQISVTTLPMPAAPVNLAATANSGTQVTITWSETIPANGLPVKYYYIFTGPSPASLTNVATRTAAEYIGTGLSPNTSYYYAVEALDSDMDVSPMSAPVQITTYALPATPVDVTATANSATLVSVTWSETVPANGMPIQDYIIFRGTSPTSLAQLTTRTAPPFIDTGAAANTTYYYAIEAVDKGQDDSSVSAPGQVTTPAMPSAPVNVTATSNSAGTMVTVTWSQNIPANGLPIKYYYIYRGTSPTSLTKLSTGATTQFKDTGVSPNTTYYYAIEALDNDMDVSPMSAPAAQVTTP